MRRSLSNFLVLTVSALFIVMAITCKSRSSDGLEGDKQATTEDTSRIDTLEAVIESLKNQLETDQKLSDAEREELEKKLKTAEEAKAKAEGTATTSTTVPTTTTTTATKTPSPTTVPRVDGPYTIYYVTDCLQLNDPNNQGDGSIFRAFPCNNTPGQQFSLEIREGGFFRIQHKSSSKCMTMAGNTAGEGTPPTLNPCKNPVDNAELWRFFDAASDGSKFKLQNRLSSFCLKIGNDGTIFQGSCTTNYTEFMLKKTP